MLRHTEWNWFRARGGTNNYPNCTSSITSNTSCETDPKFCRGWLSASVDSAPICHEFDKTWRGLLDLGHLRSEFARNLAMFGLTSLKSANVGTLCANYRYSRLGMPSPTRPSLLSEASPPASACLCGGKQFGKLLGGLAGANRPARRKYLLGLCCAILERARAGQSRAVFGEHSSRTSAWRTSSLMPSNARCERASSPGGLLAPGWTSFASPCARGASSQACAACSTTWIRSDEFPCTRSRYAAAGPR